MERLTDLKGIGMTSRYEMCRSIPGKRDSQHHELCEVTAGRKLGYWAEDLCDCKKEQECQSPR